jgi:hypothetical protein
MLDWALKATNPDLKFTILIHKNASHQTVMLNEFNPKWVKDSAIYKKCPIIMGWAYLAHLAQIIDHTANNIKSIQALEKAKQTAITNKRRAAKKALFKKRKDLVNKKKEQKQREREKKEQANKAKYEKLAQEATNQGADEDIDNSEYKDSESEDEDIDD